MAVWKIDLDASEEKALATILACADLTPATPSRAVGMALMIYAGDAEFPHADDEIHAENERWGDPPLLDRESHKMLSEMRERMGVTSRKAIKWGLKFYADKIDLYAPDRPNRRELYRRIMSKSYDEDNERSVREINLDDDAEKSMASLLARMDLTPSQVVGIALKTYAGEAELEFAADGERAAKGDYGSPPLLDRESEKILLIMRERTGLSDAQAIKAGLKIYADRIGLYAPDKPNRREAYRELYRKMDLGPGGYSEPERSLDGEDANGEKPLGGARADVGEIIRAKFERERELNREFYPR